jgi:hypothetical protein
MLESHYIFIFFSFVSKNNGYFCKAVLTLAVDLRSPRNASWNNHRRDRRSLPVLRRYAFRGLDREPPYSFAPVGSHSARSSRRSQAPSAPINRCQNQQSPLTQPCNKK